ncbi:MAG TPA: serine hydrolase domain-containing protein [Geobacteraceae bacterium]|nr:serine hydrolase domain-containing protein [Geobacteraceae bacterium]
MLRIIHAAIVVLLLFQMPLAFAGDQPPAEVDKTQKIDFLMGNAISRGLIAGGVVLVGNRRGVLFERAYGRSAPLPNAPPVQVDTVFDIASLTKVVATTPSVLRLAEEGKLSLVDPVARWLPEFAGKGKDELLVLHLLTHTSGLDDFPLAHDNPITSAVQGAAGQKLKGEIGHRFKYADINFILLGEMVRRITGQGLDRYAADSFFVPMGMKDTSFNPGKEMVLRCSATISDENIMQLGMVQDPVARRLGGVAGHAGVFSTARDLARFCRMILNEGELDGANILSSRTVRQMTAPYFSRGGNVVRGLGWDISSPFSSPRGHGFSEGSFGHTGYSGSSIWLDPTEDIFVVLLTARIDYKKTKDFSQLRSDLSSLSAEIFANTADMSKIAGSLNPAR